MKLWMRKIAVAVVTVATLGLYIPTDLLEVQAEKNKETAEDTNVNETQTEETVTVDYEIVPELYTTEDIVDRLMEKAKEQSLMKFGPRIATQVETEFETVILPEIETVIQQLVEKEEMDAAYYSIHENPSDGYGERIFNVYDERSKEKIAKFHVRRDHRPLEGHYFNFHYHLASDGFKQHHEIGDIYWDKNTPPKWMS